MQGRDADQTSKTKRKKQKRKEITQSKEPNARKRRRPDQLKRKGRSK